MLDTPDEKIAMTGQSLLLIRDASRLYEENAKLRGLVIDMGELLDVLTECDLACKHYHDGCIGDCYYVNARRELGVECKEPNG